MSHGHDSHAAAAAIVPPGTHEPADDHGHHGHHIVPRRVLLAVLGLLMFFTLATVACAQIELWIAHTFDVTIPTWVNVAVALTIATIKSVVVATYFMQLKYDNPVNTLVVVFTIICFAFFIGFSMIDLGNRDALYDYKAKAHVVGGTGKGVSIVQKNADGSVKLNDKGEPEKISLGVPIVTYARQKADAEIDRIINQEGPTKAFAKDILNTVLQTRLATIVNEWKASGEWTKPAPVDKYKNYRAYLAKNPDVMNLAHSAHGHGGHADTGSSAAQSRPVAELRLPGSDHGHGGHADHGDHDAKGAHPDKTDPGTVQPSHTPAAPANPAAPAPH